MKDYSVAIAVHSLHIDLLRPGPALKESNLFLPEIILDHLRE